MPISTIKFIRPKQHAGVIYDVGSQITVDSATADLYVADGVASFVSKAQTNDSGVPVVATLAGGAAAPLSPGSSMRAGQFYALVSPIFRLQAAGTGSAVVVGKFADGSTQTLESLSAGSVGWYGDDKLVAVSWSGPATLTVGVL